MIEISGKSDKSNTLSSIQMCDILLVSFHRTPISIIVSDSPQSIISTYIYFIFLHTT